MKTTHAPDEMEHVREMIQACIQCGTCTGSCPNAFAMDLTPRQLWQHVMLGQPAVVFGSRTFSLCSACYFCTLRCPRGLAVTEAMHALKRLAAARRLKPYKASSAFYRQFMQSVRRHGRVNELEFMSLYFADMRNPLLPLRYTGLGVRLVAKGKLSLRWPVRRTRPLEAIFRRAEEMEEGR
ncbi:MAG: 4Fe-4S dicluster domain-containing protein [Desulfobacterales bacterium]